MLILNPVTGQLVEVRVPEPGSKTARERSNADALVASPPSLRHVRSDVGRDTA
jgi:hypothetical protein